MGNNFYISDTHFGHANIIRFDGRPFSDVKEMEDALVYNWNKAVGNDDDMYILGDFCWKSEDESIRILQKLNGRKHLVKGNHDPKYLSPALRSLFQEVCEYLEVKDNGRHIILCHYPILFYRGSYSDSMWHFCGHTHNETPEEQARMKFVRELITKRRKDIAANGKPSYCNMGHIINVGCMMDYMGYTPRTADELIAWWHEYYGE